LPTAEHNEWHTHTQWDKLELLATLNLMMYLQVNAAAVLVAVQGVPALLLLL
jgi:hypothetical protein